MRAELECSDKAKKPSNHNMEKWLKMSENLTLTPEDVRNIEQIVEMPDPLFGGYVEINQTEYDVSYSVDFDFIFSAILSFFNSNICDF